MKIFPINYLTRSYSGINNINNHKSYNYNLTMTAPIKADTVSFGRKAMNAEAMRDLFKYGMIDIHTGQRVIDPDLFESFMEKRLFNSSIKTIVKKLRPLQDTLHEIENEVFTMIEECSKKFPDIKLDDAMQLLSIQAKRELTNMQIPLLNELESMGGELPPEQLAAFKNLINRAKDQILDVPIMYNFSKKELHYKLNKIASKIEKYGNAEEIKAIRHINSMVQKLPYTPSGRNFANKDKKIDLNAQKKQINQFRQISNYFYHSAVSGNKELEFIMSIIKPELSGTKVKVPFSRKTFIHELETILDTIKDKKYAHNLIKFACQLPSAKDETCAFIVKNSRSTPEDILHSLLIGQVGAIDHLVAFSKGGADSVENYGFTSIAYNSLKGNLSMKKWLEINPQTYIGAQLCVDRLIELLHEGKTNQDKFIKSYIYAFANKMKKISSKENPVIVDTSSLKR